MANDSLKVTNLISYLIEVIITSVAYSEFLYKLYEIRAIQKRQITVDRLFIICLFSICFDF